MLTSLVPPHLKIHLMARFPFYQYSVISPGWSLWLGGNNVILLHHYEILIDSSYLLPPFGSPIST